MSVFKEYWRNKETEAFLVVAAEKSFVYNYQPWQFDYVRQSMA